MTHEDSDLLRIVADIAALNSREGLVAGSAALRIEMTPEQMVQLARTLPARAIEALGLALSHGTVRSEPFRVEVYGWSRDWLIGKGMNPAAARGAIRDLLSAGITITTLGPGGRTDKRIGIIGANRCGWDLDDNVVPISDGRRPAIDSSQSGATRGAGRHPSSPGPVEGKDRQVDPSGQKVTRQEKPVDNLLESAPAGGPVVRSHSDPTTWLVAEESQVNASGQKMTKRPAPVDNVSGHFPARQDSDPTRDASVSSLSVQVSAPGQDPARRESDLGTNSEVSRQIGLSAEVDWSARSLTLADADRLLRDPALVEGAVREGDQLLAYLAAAIPDPDERVKAMLRFLGYDGGDHPKYAFAALIAQVVQTPVEDRDELAADMHLRCREGGASLRAPGPDFLTRWLLTMCAAVSTTPEKWGAFVFTGIYRERWTVAPTMRGVFTVLSRVAAGQDPAAPAAGSARAARSAGLDTAVEAVQEELREAVVGTHWEDPVSFAQLLRNPQRVAQVLARYRSRKSDPVGDEPVAAAVEDDPAQPGVDATVSPGRAGGAPAGEASPNGVRDDPAPEVGDGGAAGLSPAELEQAYLAELREATRALGLEEEWEEILRFRENQDRVMERYRVNRLLEEGGGLPIRTPPRLRRSG